MTYFIFLSWSPSIERNREIKNLEEKQGFFIINKEEFEEEKSELPKRLETN